MRSLLNLVLDVYLELSSWSLGFIIWFLELGICDFFRLSVMLLFS